MTDFVLPPSLIANEAEWSLIDYTGVQQSVLSGALRTVSRGQRWQARLRFLSLTLDDRNTLAALMAAVRGKSNRIWIPDPSYRQQGSFSCPELLTDGAFKNGAASWTAGGSCTISGYNRALRMNITGGTAPSAYQNQTLTSGYAYAMRSCIIDGQNSSGNNAGVQWADGMGGFPQISTARGLITSAALTNNGGAAAQRCLYVTSGQANGQFMLVTYTSLRRCALAVNPSANVYSTILPIDALPASTNGLLRAGDRVEVNGEMKVVTFDLNSDNTGAGYLMFEPALRKLVPDNAPIICGEPMMRCVLTDGAVQNTKPGVSLMSDFDFTFAEASS
jgi:hypothetical protein